MSTVSRSTTVRTRPTEVWAVLADLASISSWAPNVDHSCLLTPEGAGVGAKRRVQVGRNALVETVQTWEPASSFSYAISGLPPVIRSVVNRWTLESVGDDTLATLTTDIDAGPRPPQQLIARIVGRRFAAASEAMLAGLAAQFADQETSP
jgi:hypothetical protein